MKTEKEIIKYTHSYEYLLKKIKVSGNKIENSSLDIAQMVCYIKNKELWKENYRSFQEFNKKELKFTPSRISQYNDVVYKFCKMDEYSSTGYCVKSLFKGYSFSQLREMSILTEDEYLKLKINSDMSVKEIKKKVKDYLKFLYNTSGKSVQNDSDPEVEDIKEEDSNIRKYILKYMDDAIFKFYDQDKCIVKDMKKTTSVKNGLRYLENQIVKDNDNIYIVLKVPKDKLNSEGEN